MNFSLKQQEATDLTLALTDAIEYCNESLDYYKTHQTSDEYEKLIAEVSENKQKYEALLQKVENKLNSESERAINQNIQNKTIRRGEEVAKAN